MKSSDLDLTAEDLARYRTLFALRRMSPELQSDVLSDGAIVERSGIGVSNPIKLPEGVVIDRKVLFSAFQKVADGAAPPEISDVDGTRCDIKIEIDGDSGFVTLGTCRVRFPDAALLSADREKRQAVAAIILKNNTFSEQAREEFEAITSRSNFSHADFFATINIVSSSPETFATALREAAKKGSLSTDDFLPGATAYWENITARRIGSERLLDFIFQELASERAARIAQDPSVAVDVLSLTFGGPELVPLAAMRQIDAEILLAALKRLLDYTDPVSLTGAFDICVDRASDVRFVELGDAILDRLTNDPKRLHNELTTFATAFVLATAHLAEHEVLRKQPVFWRRLAAASHASLVTRILGPGADDEISLLTWATRLRGKTFYLSVLNDAHVEPRWRPDWITPDYVAADIYGRLLGSLQRLGDSAPNAWREKLESAQSSMVKDVLPLAHTFPSVLQGSAPFAEQPANDTVIGGLYADFAREPTIGNFLYFVPVVYAFGFATGARQSVLEVVKSLRTDFSVTAPDHTQAALDLAALIAAQNRDVELADATAAVALEWLALAKDSDRVLPAAAVILECAGAYIDRKEALRLLARRLENLAFVAPPGMLDEALDVFRILQSINEDLSPLLGRAVATARLGASRTAGA